MCWFTEVVGDPQGECVWFTKVVGDPQGECVGSPRWLGILKVSVLVHQGG